MEFFRESDRAGKKYSTQINKKRITSELKVVRPTWIIRINPNDLII